MVELAQRQTRLSDAALYYEGQCMTCRTWRPLGLFRVSAASLPRPASRWGTTCWWCRSGLPLPPAPDWAYVWSLAEVSEAHWRARYHSAARRERRGLPLGELDRLALCHFSEKRFRPDCPACAAAPDER